MSRHNTAYALLHRPAVDVVCSGGGLANLEVSCQIITLFNMKQAYNKHFVALSKTVGEYLKE